MWKRFFSTCFILLVISTAVYSQEAIRTSVLSPLFSDFPGTPRVINNEPGRFWVVAWRQNGSPASINCRTVRSDGTLGTVRILVGSPSPIAKNFDLIFLRETGNYLLAYELQDGVYVQSFTKTFVRQGAAIAIQKGVRNTLPRFLLDDGGKQIFLFWLATSRRGLRRVELEASGKHAGAIKNLFFAPVGNVLNSISVAENQQNTTQFAVFSQTRQSGTSKAIGIASDSEGNLLGNPITFQQFPSRVTVDPVVSFSSSSGHGIVVWHSGAEVRHRFLTSLGAPAGPFRTIENAADTNSNPSSIYDSKKEVFVQTWSKGEEILASVTDPALSTQKQEISSLAKSAGNALNASASFNHATGKSIVAWEEQVGNSYKVHATIFQVHGEEFTIEGIVSLRKDYNPPYQLNNKKYLNKFHVKSGDKVYRAYVTPESEIIGGLPKEGDRVRMEYEPFRGRYRGYVESIQKISPQ